MLTTNNNHLCILVFYNKNVGMSVSYIQYALALPSSEATSSYMLLNIKLKKLIVKNR